ncbi:MAG: FMN-dependent NADH-azoreductase [Verrucomicrobium sp.]|nr:FMN-dependent NADH-azoreductase [Verrucomicrobium sp.]
MSTLLHIDSSPRGERSISRHLGADFVASWEKAHPGSQVIYRDLGRQPVPYVDEAWIAAAFNPEATPEQKQVLALSETLIGELLAADHYLFTVPMYNLSVPAVFKGWIDQIVRVGKTFSFGENGLEGLLKGKKATFITASGSVFREGTPFAPWNFQEPYLRAIFGFIGVTDLHFVVADGVNDVNYGKVDRETYLQPVRAKAQELASA